MKTQMKFQKYLCLVMLILGALSLAYAFFYLSGSMAELGQNKEPILGSTEQFKSLFEAAEGKYDYKLYELIQPFNNTLMYCGIVMVLLAVVLYVTACNKRRNYYITNYVAIGACAGTNIVMSIVLMALNASWRSKFLNVDFDAWYAVNKDYLSPGMEALRDSYHYSESTLWFDLGFVVYALIIVASVLLVLNLVWKILLMRGEKKLLNGGSKAVEGGASV